MERVIVLLADGFEEIEAVTIIDILRRGDVEVVTASINQNPEVQGSHGIRLFADAIFGDVQNDSFAMVVLPGGGQGVENLGNDSQVVEFIKKMQKQSQVAAICAAPSLLAREGLLEGKKTTSYPSFQSVITEHGAEYKNDKVVQDTNIITSRGPATAIEFSLALVSQLKGKEIANRVASAILAKPM